MLQLQLMIILRQSVQIQTRVFAWVNSSFIMNNSTTSSFKLPIQHVGYSYEVGPGPGNKVHTARANCPMSASLYRIYRLFSKIYKPTSCRHGNATKVFTESYTLPQIGQICIQSLLLVFLPEQLSLSPSMSIPPRFIIITSYLSQLRLPGHIYKLNNRC